MQTSQFMKSGCYSMSILFLIIGLFFETNAQTIDPAIFKGLKARNLTLSRTGGRVVDIAIDPQNRSTRFVAVASGNIWRTKNAGTTWEPVFENYGSYSIGIVEIDPKNPQIVWAGTGENNSQRSVSKGDGIYKSIDGGNSWKNMGLKTSEHIGKIIIDPRNSHVVYVACQGSVWKAGGERGLYRTLNGGITWDKILHISENTGISDIIQDPNNPNVLLASSYQRRRHVGVLVAGGPDGGIWKSVDGGTSWNKLSNGLPTGDLGRIGLAISPQKSNVLYALIAGTAQTKGFYRSENHGDNWVKMSDYMVVDAQYYMELFPDPHQFDKVYSVGMRLRVTEDGGKTFLPVNNQKMHVDHHEVVFDPNDPDYLMIGNDGGIYESWDQGNHWRFVNNLPITQYYRVGVDNAKPFYHIYGGTQDNASQGVPSRTTDGMGIRNSDWYNTVGGDGFQTRIDPEDPNLVYSQSQYGVLVRYDVRSGERINIQPQPPQGASPYRWHWNAPLIISPHQGQRLYFAAERIFRSDDRGNSWQVISGDLSRGEDRNLQKVMDRVWGIDAIFKNVWTSPFGEITALDESPLIQGLIYAGTDDGLIQITEDGGKSWSKVSKISEIPEYSFVSDIFASRTDPDHVFVLFNNHKRGDYSPYILKSTNRGKSWTSMRGDLPDDEYLWSIVQDHEDRNLLFLGAEYGLYASVDGGNQWIKLKSGIPTIAIRDLEIQNRENDLVAASFGRGFYILDDYSPLRHCTKETWNQEAVLFPVKDAWQFVQTNPSGNSLGHAYFTSPNPAYGAVFTYYLKEGAPTLQKLRAMLEKQKIDNQEPVLYPDWDDLLQERLEDKPIIVFTITNTEGKFIRRITAPYDKGIQRVNWDLKHTGDDRSGGIPVSPGNYQVSMAGVVNGKWIEIAGNQEFAVVPLKLSTLPAEDPNALEVFRLQVDHLRKAVRKTDQYIQTTTMNLEKLKKWAKSQAGIPGTEIENLNIAFQQMHRFNIQLKGNHLMVEKMELVSPSISARVNRVLYGLSSTTSDPTQTQMESYQIAWSEFAEFLAALKSYYAASLQLMNERLQTHQAPEVLLAPIIDWGN